MKFLFFILLILSFFVNHYTRNFSSFLNFFLIGVINIPLTYTLLKINPYKRFGIFLIFWPLIIIIFLIVLSVVNYEKILILNSIIFILTSLIALYLFFKADRYLNTILIYIPFFFIFLYSFNFLDSYYSDSFNKVDLGVDFPHLEIFNYNGKVINLPSDRVIVIDLWSNTCSNCILEFPKFEKISLDYKDDDEVYFLSLNIFINKIDFDRTSNYLRPYSFDNYFTDNLIFKKLNFNSVPKYMVLNKEKQIVYFGNLNTEFKFSKSYIYKVIENAKN